MLFSRRSSLLSRRSTETENRGCDDRTRRERGSHYSAVGPIINVLTGLESWRKADATVSMRVWSAVPAIPRFRGTAAHGKKRAKTALADKAATLTKERERERERAKCFRSSARARPRTRRLSISPAGSKFVGLCVLVRLSRLLGKRFNGFLGLSRTE